VNSQNNSKPNRAASILVSIIMVVNGISVMFLGILYAFGTAIGEPIGLTVEALEAKAAAEYRSQIVMWLCIVYFLICLLSLLFWQKGKRVWIYVLLVLGLMHVIYFGYIFSPFFPFSVFYGIDYFAFLFYSSISLNLIMFIFILFGRNKNREIVPE
jgi:hypothetical protein